LETQDHFLSKENFTLVEEPELEMLITRPQPSEEEIGKYYEGDNYISHTDSKKGLFNFVYQKVKTTNLLGKVRLIDSLIPKKGTLLDVGSGTGDFLLTAKNLGWKISGMEVNEAARNLSANKEIPVANKLEYFNGEEFDVVTLWHVLEHMHDLEGSIKRLSSLVKEGGYLIIAVPNFRSHDAKYYGKYWAAYDVPRHLWHFSQKSIAVLFKDAFTLHMVKPMIFDAYYVSLLSEKYKSGKSISLEALWVGFISNWKARSTTEYSSLIYCLKKKDKPF